MKTLVALGFALAAVAAMVELLLSLVQRLANL